MLGLEKCATLEIRSGGAGWPQAVDIARRYLETGEYENALVIGSESISPVMAPVYLGKDPDRIRMRDRLPLYMFGDGAAAAVLQGREEPGGVVGGAMRAIGGLRKPGIHSIGGGTHAPIADQLKAKLVDLRVDVVGAGEFTPHMVVESLAECSRAPASTSDIDHCLIPEGNVGWMLDSLREAGPADARVGCAGGQDLRQPGPHRGGRLRGRAAVPRRRLAHAGCQAGRPRAGDRRRGHQVDLRRDHRRLDGSRAVAGTS